MTANVFNLSGNGLVALIVMVVALVFVALVIAKVVARDRSIRTSRIGVFIERERYDETDDEEITERKEWPQRKEGA